MESTDTTPDWDDAAKASAAADAANWEERQRYTKELPVELSEEEIARKGEELAKLEDELVKLEDEKRAESKRLNDLIKAKRADIALAAGIINSGQEERDIEVVEEMNDSGTIRTVRLDSGEVIHERAATAIERQGDLYDNAGANGADVDPEDEDLEDEPEPDADE